MEYATILKEFGPTGFLLIFVVVGIFAAGKVFRDIIVNTFKKADDLQTELRKQATDKEKFYKTQLDLQKSESEVRIAEARKELHEERLSSEKERKKFIEQLEVINQNTAKTASILEKLEVNVNSKLSNMEIEIRNIKENTN